MSELLHNEDLRGKIAFIGQTLGPFYLEDPRKGQAGPAFEAIKSLDIAAASAEWPFIPKASAASCLKEMQEGLAAGIDSEELMWEYRRLFIGPALKPAPPWGSVYTDRECVVFGKSELDLKAWMRAHGIERLQDDKSPEDHLGLMLLMMAWLVEEKPELLEDYLRLHVLTWSSHFLCQLEEAAKQPFYQGLAKLTKESLEGIQKELALEVEYPRYFR